MQEKAYALHGHLNHLSDLRYVARIAAEVTQAVFCLRGQKSKTRR